MLRNTSHSLGYAAHHALPPPSPHLPPRNNLSLREPPIPMWGLHRFPAPDPATRKSRRIRRPFRALPPQISPKAAPIGLANWAWVSPAYSQASRFTHEAHAVFRPPGNFRQEPRRSVGGAHGESARVLGLDLEKAEGFERVVEELEEGKTQSPRRYM